MVALSAALCRTGMEADVAALSAALRRTGMEADVAALSACTTLFPSKVARELCVEVLDVWELDKLAGFYTTKKADNFHVPNKASAQAAMAALLLLRLGVGARGDQQLRNCSAAPPLPPARATS